MLNKNTKWHVSILIYLLNVQINWLHPMEAGWVPNVSRSPIQTREKPLAGWQVLKPKARAVQWVVFDLAGMLVCPTVEGIHDALEMLLNRILSKWTVAKCDLKHTVNVVPKALILPEFCQDGRDCSKCMLGPTQQLVMVKQELWTFTFHLIARTWSRTRQCHADTGRQRCLSAQMPPLMQVGAPSKLLPSSCSHNGYCCHRCNFRLEKLSQEYCRP